MTGEKRERVLRYPGKLVEGLKCSLQKAATERKEKKEPREASRGRKPLALKKGAGEEGRQARDSGMENLKMGERSSRANGE